MEFKDYYQTLGVERDADKAAIKRAYRRLARKFHPDVSSEDNAEERFKEAKEAYEVLKDPDKRAAYDQFGKDWRAGQDFHPPPDYDADVAFHGGGFTDAGEFSDFFETLFGRGSRRGSGHGGLHMKGEDLSARVTIGLDDAYQGTTRSITLGVPEIDARGNVATRTRTLNVQIPKGVIAGQRIRLAGQGAAGPGDAPAGDLFLEVRLEPHRLYRAEGRDIYLQLPVAPWEAALGRTVTVPTLGGNVELKIPAGSQSGRKLRLKGRGLPGKPAGDQYVVLEVAVPRADTAKAREFYEQMERELPFAPRAALGV